MKSKEKNLINISKSYIYHNYYANKQIGENEVSQKDEDDSEPLTVRSFVQIFLNFSPTIHLDKYKPHVMDQYM